MCATDFCCCCCCLLSLNNTYFFIPLSFLIFFSLFFLVSGRHFPFSSPYIVCVQFICLFVCLLLNSERSILIFIFSFMFVCLFLNCIVIFIFSRCCCFYLLILFSHFFSYGLFVCLCECIPCPAIFHSATYFLILLSRYLYSWFLCNNSLHPPIPPPPPHVVLRVFDVISTHALILFWFLF